MSSSLPHSPLPPPTQPPSPIDQLIQSIPLPLQTCAFVGLVSLNMFELMSENSSASTDGEHVVTHHPGFDVSRHKLPQRHTNVARMFSANLAQTVGIDYGTVDVNSFVKILPPETLKEYAGIEIQCTIPIVQQRSSSDPLHPYAHTSLSM